MFAPRESPPSPSALRLALRERRARVLLADAAFIRDYPDCAERDQEGKRHIREAMHEHTVGRITLQERDQILHILSFTTILQVPLASDDRAPPSAFLDD